jgi:hypothetical protein
MNALSFTINIARSRFTYVIDLFGLIYRVRVNIPSTTCPPVHRVYTSRARSHRSIEVSHSYLVILLNTVCTSIIPECHIPPQCSAHSSALASAP